MDKTIYIVNWKETTIDENEVLTTECGTCDYGYTNEEEAKKQVAELVSEKMDELKAECEDNSLDEDMFPVENYNECRDYGCVTFAGNTYEYNVLAVVVAM